ncbi:histidine phosphatase family protein [Microbacterium sp. NPDC057407]|uniref:histidine phosphatase family protein n=1 Tax=Microbacterium sp. NPDC057407 TaxID=3346120 RepID=UPI003670567B
MAVSELFLVRHGESVGNVAATRAELEGLDVIPLDIRDADVPLSDTGREQAAALGEWLDDHHGSIDTYWVSPYLRAQETLRIALRDRATPTPPVTDERLRDRELGILDLLTRRGAAARHPEEMARRLHLGKFYHRPPGGESWADVALRLRSFLRDHLDGPGDRALVVAHDAVVMLILYVLLPLREQELLDFAADHTVLNASVTHLVRREGGWDLAVFSDVAHLQREGADITVHPGSPDVEPA